VVGVNVTPLRGHCAAGSEAEAEQLTLLRVLSRARVPRLRRPPQPTEDMLDMVLDQVKHGYDKGGRVVIAARS
jgi:hypothetical protein